MERKIKKFIQESDKFINDTISYEILPLLGNIILMFKLIHERLVELQTVVNFQAKQRKFQSDLDKVPMRAIDVLKVKYNELYNISPYRKQFLEDEYNESAYEIHNMNEIELRSTMLQLNNILYGKLFDLIESCQIRGNRTREVLKLYELFYDDYKRYLSMVRNLSLVPLMDLHSDITFSLTGRSSLARLENVDKYKRIYDENIIFEDE